MNDKTISTKKFIIKYGLIFGTIWIIYFFIKYLVTDSVYAKGDDIFSIILEITIHILLVYPIHRYKLINNGFLSLKQALKIGMSIALISYLMPMVYEIVVFKIIEPEQIVKRLNDARENMLVNNPDMSPEDIRETIKAPKKFNSFYIIQLMILILNLMFSFIISLVTGSIMYKKKEL